MEEYERSFKVETVKPYIDYCVNNKYTLLSVTKENRIVYENKSNKNLIARITIRVINRKKEMIFDCKNIDINDKDLKISKESLPIKISNKNKDAIYSLLGVLNFYEAANNVRTRYVYQKNSIKFEIDDYEIPKMHVVAIEGEKDEVEIVYEDLKNNIQE